MRDGVQAVQADALAQQEAALGAENRTPLHDVRVLVVDDEPESREVVAAVLTLHGAEVTLAGSAEEALRLLGRTQPHVIVSDISMPDKDGYSLLQAIRALTQAEGGQTPAIALTAAATTQDRLRALRAGFQFHLPKPVAPAELIQSIVSVIDRGL